MAKIIYSVMGEGFGHAVRSKVIIEHLSKKHDVRVYASGKAYAYLHGLKNVSEIESLHLEYKDNKVLFLKTFIENIKKYDKVMHSYREIKEKIKLINPGLVICDFEPLANYAAFFTKVPCLSIDNQHFIMHGKYPHHRRHFLSFLMTYLISHSFIIRAKYKIIFSLNPQKSRAKIFFHWPILRESVKKFAAKKGEHFFVYQTTDSNTKIIEELKRIDHTFIVYGYNKNSKDGNLIFRKFDDKLFLRDLAGCRAAILGGGFTTISEAIYYKKPVLITPVKKQFEQTVNALIIKKEGYGDYIEDISKEKIEQFIKKIDVYKKRLNLRNEKENKEVLKKIDNIIAEIN